MCTAFTLRTKEKEIFFGRNMDFSYEIDPHVYVVPANYLWTSVIEASQIRNRYKFIGIGQEAEGLLGFFDGVNENGFAAAALYFAGYARYETHVSQEDKIPVASFEFLHYILGNCSGIADLKTIINQVSVIGMEDPVTHTTAPLHWIATDRTGACVVMEPTKDGLVIMDNPIGVMANSPDFSWHMTNLRNYTEASPVQREEASWNGVELTPFGQAGGTKILPGGFTSPDRFVRTAYLKSFLPIPQNSKEGVISCFHIMESVTIPKGAVLTSRGTYDYTKYTAFINTTTCEYFFKTYDSLLVYSAGLYESNHGVVFPVEPGRI